MKSEKEIRNKITELREKSFDILEQGISNSPFKRTSIRTIRAVINALEYCLDERDDLMILEEVYSKSKGGNL